MSESTEARAQERPIRFHLEVAGELDQKWAAWFQADTMAAEAGRTVVELRVADEAELHGLLRRVHDLHLRLISLTRID